MQGKRYYRIMIALPAAASLSAFLFVALYWQVGWLYGILALIFAALGDAEAEGTFGLLLLLGFLSPVTLGCFVASAVLLRRLRDQPEAAYIRASKLAPIWVGAATFLAASALFFVALDFNDSIVLGLIVGLFGVFVAYVYVGLAAILLSTLRAASLVEGFDHSEASAAPGSRPGNAKPR